MLYQGIDNIESIDAKLRVKRLGLITNPTGLDRNLNTSVDVIRAKYTLVQLFAPEHGIYGNKQAGDEVGHEIDSRTGIPVQSMYGQSFDLSGLDCLLYDIQDVGLRFYTYIYVMGRAMKACGEQGIPFVVLDRHNPLGLTIVEGPIITDEFKSGVGDFRIPSRYALTPGELAQYLNAEYNFGCDLTIVKCSGLTRTMLNPDTRLPWIQPSPNIPTFETALCYAGTVVFEGTNLSEGRGTTKPFEMIGAPWLDVDAVLKELRALDMPGVMFRSTYFTPTFSKHEGKMCAGIQLFVRDYNTFRPFECGLAMLNIIRRLHSEFDFVPFGGEAKAPFIDLLTGTDAIRLNVYDEKRAAEDMKKREEFLAKCEPFHLY